MLNFKTNMLKSRWAPVDQLDRSSDYGSEGWGFESSRARHNVMKKLFVILVFLLFPQLSIAERVDIFKFTKEELSSLKSHSLKKKTDYSVLVDQNGKCVAANDTDLLKLESENAKEGLKIVKDGNVGCLKAEAQGQASGLGKEIKIDLNKTPFLNITWKVEQGLKGLKENTKKGHDFAARVSVIKETGSLPWQKNVMNYVFSSNEKTNSHWVGPYRKQIHDYVASSLIDNPEGSWVTVKLNVKEHFKEFFEKDYDEIDGVAIMTDTDNSKKMAVSYYKEVYFSD